ncbi:MAG: tryptophan 7-halogenase [Wenzhouxiangella sp.]|nr:MAG: tryptophan 7-halogenase [Wenzhouxiangella sp.]
MDNPDNQGIRHIVIVGGGSAGWITAGLLASSYPAQADGGIRVTLVESPEVSTIGVGEGTWPTMRATLRRIGLSETEFLQACSASPKQGTRFRGWVTGSDDDVYYHPFSVPAGYPGAALVPFWQEHRERVSFANAVTAQGRVCDAGLAPKEMSTPEYAHVVNYGYHLDAGKFADLLKAHCIDKLKVRHLLDHVTGILGAPDEDIRALATAGSGEIEGDLFIDCTGQAALLLGRHYGVDTIDQDHILFNDRALAVQVPYAHTLSPVESQTNSTAQDAGWVWDIGLSSRRGIGYVYSSRHSSDEQALEVLRRYLGKYTAVDAQAMEPRRIGFRPGYRERFWHRNCVAVGMSAGFIEPLEASALVMIELAAGMITDELPATRSAMDIHARRFNEKFRYRWERIIDFLKLHYVLSRRDDSDYWIDNRHGDSIPERLQGLIELWRHQVPGPRDFPQIDEIFSAASYQYVLYGMGFETRPRMRAQAEAERVQAHALFKDVERLSRRLLARLPDNRSLLAGMAGPPGAGASLRAAVPTGS